MSNWLRLPFGYGSAGECYLVPVAEGDALLAVAAAAVAWRPEQWTRRPRNGSPAAQALYDAVVAHEAATAPKPPEPTCADCGTAIPADQTPIPCESGVTCYGCAEARHRRQRKAERVRAAIEAHQGQGVEFRYHETRHWCDGVRPIWPASVSAIRWRVPCPCPDCDGHVWEEQRFEEERP